MFVIRHYYCPPVLLNCSVQVVHGLSFRHCSRHGPTKSNSSNDHDLLMILIVQRGDQQWPCHCFVMAGKSMAIELWLWCGLALVFQMTNRWVCELFGGQCPRCPRGSIGCVDKSIQESSPILQLLSAATVHYGLMLLLGAKAQSLGMCGCVTTLCVYCAQVPQIWIRAFGSLVLGREWGLLEWWSIVIDRSFPHSLRLAPARYMTILLPSYYIALYTITWC